MRMYDIIMKKRNGGILSAEEIDFWIQGYVANKVTDYQSAALLMAIYFQGMDKQETANLTKSMAESGDMVDLSQIQGLKVDKHSTGGVGDKTTLIVAPIVAACGGKIAKMSGRGLGHTGGTIDKLESIPGYQTEVTRDKFFATVEKTGLSIIGQSGNLAPADKKLYALRDVTATVDSIPLIASSIMSKKLAAGSDCIVLDVKCGSGAFMKNPEQAQELAQTMVDIGENNQRHTMALITDMDRPLGQAIGNALEVQEAIAVLRNQGPEDLCQVSLALAACMLQLLGRGSYQECYQLAKETVEQGSALNKLVALVEAQGGDSQVIVHPELFPQAPYQHEVICPETGYIDHMDTECIGIASMLLGAGRETKTSKIDYKAGIILQKKTGDEVKAGDVLATLYTSEEKALHLGEAKFLQGLHFSQQPPPATKLIHGRVTKQGVARV